MWRIIDEGETRVVIDWVLPEDTKDYLLMLGYVRKLLEVQQMFAEAMHERMQLIRELRDVAKRLIRLFRL